MNIHSFTLTMIAGAALSLAGTSAVHCATVASVGTGLEVTLDPGDKFSVISLPDIVVGASIPFDIKIYNDTGSTRPLLGLSFTVPAILPAPLALSLSSPDLGLDPPEGPGFFDLAGASPGAYTATIGGVSGGVPDGAGTPPGTPDGTFLFLYAPPSTGGPSTVTFTGVSLLVPEPGSALLALVGVLGLIVRRRR